MRVLSKFSFLLLLFAPAFSFAAPATSASSAANETVRQGSLLPISKPGYRATEDAKRFSAICEDVLIDDAGFDLGDMERRLLCGDGTSDQVGRPWKQIPPNQAAFFAKGFLQTRGYHQPEFLQDVEKLFIKVGPVSQLKEFRVTGGPPTWDPPKRRMIKGSPLTPSLLDDLQGWTLGEIKNEGYACADAETRADPGTGEALVYLKPGRAMRIIRIEDTGDPGLRDGVLDRQNAFLIGDLYRERTISLTKRRIQEDGFLQTMVLTTRCDEDGVTLVRDVVLGPSRTVRIGVGGSTEEGARFRAVVRRSRIGESASSAQARLNFSFLSKAVNHQVADGSFRWFYAPGESRSYLEPAIIFEHTAEVAFESESVETKALHGWTLETTDGQYNLRAGPSLLSSSQRSSLGPQRTSVTFAELGARWTAHDFEWFGTSPRTGEYVDASVLVTQRRWGAEFTAQKFQIQGEKLWNLFRYDPPLFIIGVRFNVSSVFSPDDGITSDLPVRFLTFLGGENDLRGFDRQSLPRSGVGALSGATASIEGRGHRVLFRRVDAFTFLDAGVLGRARLQLDRPVFMSPGVGLRWESPVGVLRGYIAQRFAIAEESNEPTYGRDWRVGFTFGEEF